MKAYIEKQELTSVDKMDTLVEFKRSFNTDVCELHLFETHQTAHNVSLNFKNLTFTSMIQGKKKVKLGNSDLHFTYVPGSSVLVAPNEEMLIDFPEATEIPSQCMALTINPDFLNLLLEQNNSEDRKINDDSTWSISAEAFYISNSESLASASNQMLEIMLSGNIEKDRYAEHILEKLIHNIMHSQAQELLNKGKSLGRFGQLTQYIKNNLHEKLIIEQLANYAGLSISNFFKMFKQEIGMSPNDYILKQRLILSKKLLKQRLSVSDVAFQTGFYDANYFTKTFKKAEGVTPKNFQMNYVNNSII